MNKISSAKERFESLVLGAPEFAGENFVLKSEEEYEEVLKNIEENKYLTNEIIPFEISPTDAVFSWHQNLYLPLMSAIDREGLTRAFPGHTRAEVFLWVCRHWHFLKEEKASTNIEEAVRSFGAKFAQDGFSRFYFRLKLLAAAA